MILFLFDQNSNSKLNSRKFRRIFLGLLAVVTVALSALAAGSDSTVLSTKPSSPSKQVDIELLSKADQQVPRSELPKSAILIALGHDSKTVSLQIFANFVEKRLRRKVVTYRQFADAHYISNSGKWWDNLPFKQVTEIVEQAIRKAVDRYPNSKIVAFNLDTYSPKEFFGPSGEEVVTYTNFEVRLLLCDPQLYLATRWYHDSRELTSQEAEAFWAPVTTALRKQCLVTHLRQQWVQQ